MSKEEILDMFKEISGVIVFLDKKKVGDEAFERLQALVKKMTLLGNRIERGEVGQAATKSDEEKSEESEEENLYDEVDIEGVAGVSSEEDQNQYDVVASDEHSDSEEEADPSRVFQTQTSNIGTSAKVMNAKAIHKSFLWMKKGLLKQDERLWSVLTPDGLYLYNSAKDPVHKVLIDPLQGAQVATAPGNLKKFVITLDINGKKIQHSFATDDESKTTDWVKSVNKASKWNLMDNKSKPHKKQKNKEGSRAASANVRNSTNKPAKLKNDGLSPQNKNTKEKKIKTPYARSKTENFSNPTKEKPRSRSNTGAIKSTYGNSKSPYGAAKSPYEATKSPYGKNKSVPQFKQNSNSPPIKSKNTKYYHQEQQDFDEYITPIENQRESIGEYMTPMDYEETQNPTGKTEVYDDTTVISDSDSDKNTIVTPQLERNNVYDDAAGTGMSSDSDPDKNTVSSHQPAYGEHLPREEYSDDDQAYIDVTDDQEYLNYDQEYLNDDQEYFTEENQGYSNAEQDYYRSKSFSDFSTKQKPSITSPKIIKGNAPKPPVPIRRDTHSADLSPPQKPKQRNIKKESSPVSSRPDSISSIEKIRMKFNKNKEEDVSMPPNPSLRKGSESPAPRMNKSVPHSKTKPKKGNSKGPTFQIKAPPSNLTLTDELSSVLLKKRPGAFANLP